jgi:phosphatidate cytidylyltransferase
MPTPWMIMLAAVVFLAGLWEGSIWRRSKTPRPHRAARGAPGDDGGDRMGLAPSTGPTLVLVPAGVGDRVIWWLLADVAGRSTFASDYDSHARMFAAAGALTVIPAWCALPGSMPARAQRPSLAADRDRGGGPPTPAYSRRPQVRQA